MSDDDALILDLAEAVNALPAALRPSGPASPVVVVILDRLVSRGWVEIHDATRRALREAHAAVRVGVIEDDYQRGRAHGLDDVYRWFGLDQ